MNQKGFVYIILVIVAIILIGVVGYFPFLKKSEPITQQSTSNQTTASTETSVSPTPLSVVITTDKLVLHNEVGYSDNSLFVLSTISGQVPVDGS